MVKIHAVILGCVLVSGSLVSVNGHAMGGIAIVGAGDYATPSQTASTGEALPNSHRLGLGFGVIADLRTGFSSSIEAGAIYVRTKYAGTTLGTGVTTVTSVPWVQIPILLRSHFTRFFSLGLGGYLAKQFGNGTVDSSTGSSVTGPFAYSKTDYGAVGSARLRFPIGMFSSIIIDARYLYGIKDLDASAGKYRMRQAEVLAGLHFGM